MFFLIFVVSVLGRCTRSKLKAGENLFEVIQRGIFKQLTEKKAYEFCKKPLVGAIEFLKHCREPCNPNNMDDAYNWLLTLKGGKKHVSFLQKFKKDRGIMQNEWQPNLSSLLLKYRILNVVGIPLESLPRKNNFPEVIDVLLDYIEKNGNVQGIYRVSGSSEKADRVLEKLISGEEITEGPHAATTALKRILSGLPDSIFGLQKVPFWIEIASYEELDIRNEVMISQILNLKPMHRIFLKKFINHLRSFNVEITKMGPLNFAISVGPSLLYSNDLEEESELATNQKDISKAPRLIILQYLIDNVDSIFPE